MANMSPQLVNYIAPGAPATRRPATGDEPFLRPEIGFTPAWFRQHLDIDFGENFHADPAYRRESVIAMHQLLRQRFPSANIGRFADNDQPLDLLTGVYGACTVAAIYGVPIVYAADNWPNCEHKYLSDEEVDRLQPPDLDDNAHFQRLMNQVGWIARTEGIVAGYVNWQGVLNNAYRLRGQPLFMDLMEAPERAEHLLKCVCETMIEAATRLHTRQRQTGFDVRFFTVSNCLVNMVSPRQYQQFLLPHDQRIAAAFGCIGIHNCAWSATPYLGAYAQVPNVAYLDMGHDSDLAKAKALFANTRRAIMYTPMDLANKPLDKIAADLQRIAQEYGPCDLVCADIEAGTPDERVAAVIERCQEISRRHAESVSA
jgi:hypothetical protein